jgi:hypothetical protein
MREDEREGGGVREGEREGKVHGINRTDYGGLSNIVRTVSRGIGEGKEAGANVPERLMPSWRENAVACPKRVRRAKAANRKARGRILKTHTAATAAAAGGLFLAACALGVLAGCWWWWSSVLECGEEFLV